MLKDTAQTAVSSATVMLLNPKDSTLVNFSTSDAKGNFIFRNIRKTNYLLKVSHIAFMPKEILINPTENKDISLGVIMLNPIAGFLMEVVIKEAKAPIFIKGDTVEYDATMFKVPPGSTVEDLLRKLPGIEVDVEGNISTMGRDVKTVLVEGKPFFGNDPKVVTQNFDAQAVSKVQVFTEKSEQEKLTGISDGSQDKAINLELKEDYKKGYFGKASAGYGWGENAPHRWQASGSINWFTDKQQLSFVGFGNNINSSNMSGVDMSEFRGQSVQTGRDNGNFGFRAGSSMSSPSFTSSGSGGTGFSNRGGGGVNYNYYEKKVKFNVGYLYSVNKTFGDVFAKRQTFLTDSTFWRMDTTHNKNLRQHHNFFTRFEYQIDTANNIILRANIVYVPNKRSYTTDQLYQTAEFEEINRHFINNKYESDNFNFEFLTIYNHKFKKKKRSFSISGFYNYKNGNNWENIENLNQFYDAASISEQIKYWVRNSKNSEDHTVRSSILYVEPIGKRVSLSVFYNFRNRLSRNNNNSTNPENNAGIDSLWLNYQNNTLYNRVGTSLNYGYNGINITAGAAFQSLMMKGTCETKLPFNEKFTPKLYQNFIPYFSSQFQLPKNVYINASYSYDVSEPDFSYLFPMPDLSNTLYKIKGNPYLTPERFHDVDARISYRNNSSMFNIMLNVSMMFYESQIVYNQIVEKQEQGFVTTRTPSNVKGGNSYSSYLSTNFPIVRTILTMNVSANGSISNSPVFINGIENITRSKGYGGNIGVNLSVGERLSFSAGARISQNFTKYSIQTNRNQSYINYSAHINAKWQVFKKTYLEGNYRFTNHTNKKLDLKQDLHVLNLSVRQVIGKKNQWELRATAVDLLNQTKSITQNATANYIEYRTAPTLARYFMLTVSYNLKGFEVKKIR